MNEMNKWLKSCLKKKSLSEGMADIIIERAKKIDGIMLYKYYCHYCGRWHLSKKYYPGN